MAVKIIIGILVVALLVLVGFNIYWMQTAKTNSNKVEVVKVTEEKVPVPAVAEKSDKIVVDFPTENADVISTSVITGKARGNWFFEGSFPIVLFDANGSVLSKFTAKAKGDWMTVDFVPFEATLEYTVPQSIGGRLVFIKDNPSGLAENDDSFELKINLIGEDQIQDVDVYFHNEQLNKKITVCDNVFAVKRKFVKTPMVATKTLEALLSGPTAAETAAGYTLMLSPLTKLNSLKIEEGTAYADFDENLDKEIGGSCRVSGMRAEIEKTLLQFPTVKNVVISRNGDVETALQP